MRAKRLLCSILAVAMILGMMSFPAFADEETSEGDSEVSAVAAGDTGDNKDPSVDEGDFEDPFGEEGGDEDNWDDNTVKVGDKYYLTLAAALTGVYMSNPTDVVTIECKPGADVGTMTHAHVADSIIIEGNGAYVSGGEHDIEVDTYKFSRETGKGDNSAGVFLDKNIEITVNSLNGIAAWGQRNTDNEVKLTFNDCKNMNRVYISGKTGTNNITLNNCSFDADQGSNNNTSVYSNAQGTIELNNVTFNKIGLGVNLNNKSDGRQNVTVNNCTFTDCSTPALAEKVNASAYAAPIRVLTSNENGVLNLKVEDCRISYSDLNDKCVNGDILLGDKRKGQSSYPNVNADISGTAAQVQLHNTDNDGIVSYTVAADEAFEIGNAVAKINDTKYSSLQSALNAVTEANTTVVLLGTISENSVNLPASAENLTIEGNGTAIIKDTVIKAADSTTLNYDGLTFNGITFDNSYILMTGWKPGSVVYKNLVFTNNVFKNIVNTDSNAAIHFNNAAKEAVQGLTITGNVIDGVSGSSTSGIYTGAVDGEIVISDNIIKNVAFRPFILQITNNNGTEDNVTVTGNTFSDSPVGRLQIVGVDENGTDTVHIAINNNVIHDVTGNFELCCWSLNDAKTIRDLSGNYWGAGVVDNYSDFYWNGYLTSNEDLVKIGIFPAYSALNEDGTIDKDSIVTGEEFAAARIADKLYLTIEEAIAAAKENDEITISAGTYNAFTVPADKNNLTFVGVTDAEGNNLVTIKTLEEDVDTHTRGIFVQAETTTLKNLNITAGTVAGARSSWMSASVGNTNGDTGARSNLKNLTIEHCEFTGSGVYQAVWTNQGNITVTDSKFSNYRLGIDDYAIGAEQKLVVENTGFTDVYAPFHTGEAREGSKIEVTDSSIVSDVIDVGGAVDVIITNSNISKAKVTIYNKANMTISESALYGTDYAIYEGCDGAITLNKNYADNVSDLAALSKAGIIIYETYYKTEEDLENGNLSDVPVLSEVIYVQFEDVTADDAEGEKLYNINLVATDEAIINRLNSADLTFAFEQIDGAIAYEIIASNSEVTVNPVDGSAVRYEFHYNGKDDVTTDSAKTITIGQVRFEGYGSFDFAVDADAATNVVYTTTMADNMVDTFVPNGDTTTAANGELVIDEAKLESVEIAVPTKNLTIIIDFPNAVEDQDKAYQGMTVTIAGNDYSETISLGQGEDAVAMEDGKYTVEVEDVLMKGRAYTVTVEGLGYRTARCTVTMTEDKTLNFWNNVKDVAVSVEQGKVGGEVTKNFLAGDIVKDNNINIYDLSAVVSYFGTENLVDEHPEYARYDLNRDGKIDSKDVAYVLVSWGE